MAIASGQRKRAADSTGTQSANVPPLRSRPTWALLEKHFQKLKGVHLRQLFADDHGRGERLAVEAAGVYLDYSKNRITDETLKLLLQLAQESRLRDHIDAMFRGDNINVSENRAVLHVVARMILARQTSFCGARHIGNILVVPANAVGHHPLDYSHPAR